MTGQDIAFDLTADDSDDDRSFAPAAYLTDARIDPAVEVEAADWESHNNERLYAALEALDERSRTILRERWLSDEGKTTLQVLAERYGVSAERIRQLENAAIRKLQTAMAT